MYIIISHSEFLRNDCLSKRAITPGCQLDWSKYTAANIKSDAIKPFITQTR